MSNSEMYEQISEWLDTYHSGASERQKTKLKKLIVSQMTPVVKHIARTIARRADDPIEDLVQAGYIGLLKAIDRFSKEKNDNFRVYAGHLIIGEMKHFLRDKLNMIRVPGHIQELVVRINNFTKTLTNEEVYNLTSADVAAALDVPVKTVDFALQMERRSSTLSLEDVFSTEEDSLGYEEVIADNRYEQQVEYNDLKLLFNDVVNKLPPEAKIMLDMYYSQDMNQKEIANALQISQMCVSRRMRSVFNTISDYVMDKKISKNRGDN